MTPPRKVLLFYLSESSGHHRAAMALQEGLDACGHGVISKTVNTLRLTNPILEQFVIKTYLGVLKNTPEFWDYLYDNRDIKQKIEYFQKFVHMIKAGKMLKLLAAEKPSVLVCTQAFPCGIIAEGKARGEITAPLIAVVTDYVAHAYWVYPQVDLYVVPCEAVKEQLLGHGISEEKILPLGIPVSPSFSETPKDLSRVKARFGLKGDLPLVLIMGGGYGLGPMDKMVSELDALPEPFDIVVVTGINEGLKKDLERRRKHWSKTVKIHGYLSDVAPLMAAAKVLVTKPGGLTISEAMASTLPMVLLDPLPGQEIRNAGFLLRQKVGMMARDSADAAACVHKLLTDKALWEQARESIKQLRRPGAAKDIAREILKRVHAHGVAV